MSEKVMRCDESTRANGEWVASAAASVRVGRDPRDIRDGVWAGTWGAKED